MEFEQWWSRNKDLYNLVNVTKEIAKAIWSDAVFITGKQTIEEITQILQEHE